MPDEFLTFVHGDAAGPLHRFRMSAHGRKALLGHAAPRTAHCTRRNGDGGERCGYLQAVHLRHELKVQSSTINRKEIMTQNNVLLISRDASHGTLHFKHKGQAHSNINFYSIYLVCQAVTMG